MSAHELAELFPDELAERLRSTPILVLPIGTIEWHSHHLPLGTDGLIAADLGRAVATRADAVLGPTSYWAVGGVPYPYTLTLPIELIEPLLVAQFEQFGEMGFAVVLALAGHFGLEQTLAMKRAAVAVMRRSPVTVLPIVEYDLVAERYGGDHAGVGETSLLWATRPELVRLDAVAAERELAGVIGADPRAAASSGLGVELRELIVRRAADVARRHLDVTALERRRYVEALAAGVRVLDSTARARRTAGRDAVPPVATPAYLDHCQALWGGDYARAQASAEQKLADLAR